MPREAKEPYSLASINEPLDTTPRLEYKGQAFLDHTIYPHLFDKIISYSDQDTLTRLMRTCYAIAKRAGPILYEEISIDPSTDQPNRTLDLLPSSEILISDSVTKLGSISRRALQKHCRLFIIRSHIDQDHWVDYQSTTPSRQLSCRYHLSESSVGCKLHTRCRRVFLGVSGWVICRSVPQYDFFSQITSSKDHYYNYPLDVARLTVTLPSGSLCEAPLKRQSKLPIPPKDDICTNLDLLFIPDSDGFFRTSNLKGNSTGSWRDIRTWRDIRKILTHWLSQLPFIITIIGSETFCPTWTAKGRLCNSALSEAEDSGMAQGDKGGEAEGDRRERQGEDGTVAAGDWTFDKELLAALDGTGAGEKENEEAKGRLRVISLGEYIEREEARTVFDPPEVKEIRRRLMRREASTVLVGDETA